MASNADRYAEAVDTGSFAAFCPDCQNTMHMPTNDPWADGARRCGWCNRPLTPPDYVREGWDAEEAKRPTPPPRPPMTFVKAIPTKPRPKPQQQQQRGKGKKRKKRVVREKTTGDYQSYIRSAEWLRIRELKFHYAGRKCERCGSARELQVHHKTYARLGNEYLADLEVLCGACHERHHEIDIQAKRHLDSIARE